MSFQKAVRSALKVRAALAGPSGSGKTYTALLWAHTLGKKIALVDTEHGSASIYVGVNGWDFDTEIPATFDPAELAKIVHGAATDGYDVLIVDSWSLYWSGTGGMLELSEKLQTGHNKFSGWSKANERERAMLDALLSFPGHVIVTLRTKSEKIPEKDERGKIVATEVVTRVVQREGFEYEFAIVGEMNQQNQLLVTKSRFPAMTVGEVFDQPGAELIRTIADYLASGDVLPAPQEYADRALAPGVTRVELRALLDEVHRIGYDGAGVLDPAGNAIGLRDFIIELGRALS